ncbi:MAG: hypothetical protein WCP09_00915 [Candidatus Taylorbacteria bacterium]
MNNGVLLPSDDFRKIDVKNKHRKLLTMLIVSGSFAIVIVAISIYMSRNSIVTSVTPTTSMSERVSLTRDEISEKTKEMSDIGATTTLTKQQILEKQIEIKRAQYAE